MNKEASLVTWVPLVAIGGMVAIGAPSRSWSWQCIGGLALAAAALTALTVARLNLGDSFSVTPQAKKLVTSGIYSKIRHPVYVFSWLALAGLALYFEKPVLLLLLLPVIPLQVWRARKEEAALEGRFGGQYREYRAKTWF